MNRSILDEVDFSPEKGPSIYKDVRYLPSGPRPWPQFQKAIERNSDRNHPGSSSRADFREELLSSKKYREVFQIPGQDIVKFMIEMDPRSGGKI